MKERSKPVTWVQDDQGTWHRVENGPHASHALASDIGELVTCSPARGWCILEMTK